MQPLAWVQLWLKGTFQPDAGFLGVSAQLSPASYLLSQDCHLVGGFAFYSWFGGEHKDDFVLSLGGYHPNYQPQKHYPQVPRLAFNWKVTPQLSISGDGYFALVPSAVMAGTHFTAIWQSESGNLKAWFLAGVDFLISWKPYHYEAHAYVDIGVAYTFSFFGTHTITVEVGADLKLWGPDFSGIATIHLWIVDLTVAFGANQSTSRTPVKWGSFRTMLPERDKWLSIAVEHGLVKGGKNTPGAIDLGVVNPKELTISIQSALPISSFEGVVIAGAVQPFGITPMDHKGATTTLKLDLSSGLKLSREVITKKYPSALWGNGGIGGTGKDLTEALACGVRLRTEAPKESGLPRDFEVSAYETKVIGWKSGHESPQKRSFDDWHVDAA